jgi:hypothetical protein
MPRIRRFVIERGRATRLKGLPARAPTTGARTIPVFALAGVLEVRTAMSRPWVTGAIPRTVIGYVRARVQAARPGTQSAVSALGSAATRSRRTAGSSRSPSGRRRLPRRTPPARRSTDRASSGAAPVRPSTRHSPATSPCGSARFLSSPWTRRSTLGRPRSGSNRWTYRRRRADDCCTGLSGDGHGVDSPYADTGAGLAKVRAVIKEFA